MILKAVVSHCTQFYILCVHASHLHHLHRQSVEEQMMSAFPLDNLSWRGAHLARDFCQGLGMSTNA